MTTVISDKATYSTYTARLYELLFMIRAEITSITAYAVFKGLVELSLPLGVQAIITYVMGGFVSTSLILLITLVVLGVILNGALHMAQLKVNERVQQNIMVRFGLYFAASIPHKDPIHDRQLFQSTSYFMDTQVLQKGFSKLLMEMPIAVIRILIGITVLCFYHPIFLLFGGILLFLLWIILKLTASRGMESSIAESNYKYRTFSGLQSQALNAGLLRQYADDSFSLKSTDQHLSGYLKARNDHFSVLLLQFRSLIGFKALLTALMLIAGSYLLIQQQLSIGQFIAAEILIISVLGAVEKIITMLDSVYDVLTSLKKLDTLPSLPEEKSGMMKLDKKDAIEISVKTLQTEITIQQGNRVLIYGDQSNHMMNLYELLSLKKITGQLSIQVNKLPLEQYHPATLRNRWCNAGLHDTLMEGTMIENLLLGQQDISESQVVMLAEQIGLHEHIVKLPHGYHTLLSPFKNDLSPEIKSYIYLLRAIIHQPDVMVLYEPFRYLNQMQHNKLLSVLETLDSAIILFTLNQNVKFNTPYLPLVLEGDLLRKEDQS